MNHILHGEWPLLIICARKIRDVNKEQNIIGGKDLQRNSPEVPSTNNAERKRMHRLWFHKTQALQSRIRLQRTY